MYFIAEQSTYTGVLFKVSSALLKHTIYLEIIDSFSRNVTCLLTLTVFLLSF